MNKIGYLITGIAAGVLLTVLTFIMLSGATNPAVLAQSVEQDDDSPQPFAPSAAIPDAPLEDGPLIYFTPQDNNNNATILFLYNTNVVASTVIIDAYTLEGVHNGRWTINLEPKSLRRLVSDPMAAGSPTSWTTPAPYLINFMDSSAYAAMSIPSGVKADGYVVFNGAGGIDPNIDQGAIKLLFSSDPSTVFLPTVQNQYR